MLRSRRDLGQLLGTAGANIGLFALSAVTGPLLARSLGASARGDLAAVTVPGEIFGYILAFGFPEASIYYAKKYSNRQLLMSAWAFAGVVGSVIVAVVWWFVPQYLHGHNALTVPWLRALLVVMVTFVPVQVVTNLLRMRNSMVAFNGYRAVKQVVNTLAIVALYASGELRLETALAAAVGSQIAYHVIVVCVLRAWPGRGFRRGLFRLQVDYGSRLALGSLSEMVVARLDQFLLVGVVASSQLGLYTVAVTAASFSSPAAWAVALVVFPQIRSAPDEATAWALTRRAVLLTLASSTCFALVVGSLAPVFLPLFFGHEFAASVRLLWILLPGQICFDLANVLAQKLMADGLPGRVSRAYLVAAVITVAGLAALVGPLGVVGASLVTSLSEAGYLAYVFASVRGTRGAPRPDADEIVADLMVPTELP